MKKQKRKTKTKAPMPKNIYGIIDWAVKQTFKQINKKNEQKI